MSEELDIIEGLHAGTESAVHLLHRMHYRSLCYFCEKLLTNRAESEDIAEESFLKMLQRNAGFHSLAQIKSFLFTTARNACIDQIRRKRAEAKGLKEIEYFQTDDLSAFSEMEVVKAQLLQTIYAEMENLPGQCKRIFKSVFVEGKNTATIAAELGLKSQTVLNQKIKALRLLRLKLQDQGLYMKCLLLLCLQFLFGGR